MFSVCVNQKVQKDNLNYQDAKEFAISLCNQKQFENGTIEIKSRIATFVFERTSKRFLSQSSTLFLTANPQDVISMKQGFVTNSANQWYIDLNHESTSESHISDLAETFRATQVALNCHNAISQKSMNLRCVLENRDDFGDLEMWILDAWMSAEKPDTISASMESRFKASIQIRLDSLILSNKRKILHFPRNVSLNEMLNVISNRGIFSSNSAILHKFLTMSIESKMTTSHLKWKF